jgi:peptide/nickel transport system substrate-binding protein
MRMRRGLCLFVVAVLLLAASFTVNASGSKEPATGGAAASPAPATPVLGGTLKIGVKSEVANTAAWRLRSPQEKIEWSCCYETLFKIDKEGKVVPNLAASLKADFGTLTYTVTLRDDVYFSDGSRLDADVLLWNFTNFKTNSQTASTHFGDVASFEKKDNKTVAIHLSQWNSQIPYSLNSVPGLMYSKKAFDEHGLDWTMKNPVGTGPYVLDSWVNGEIKTFKKNPNYWNKQVKVTFDSIEFRVVKDEMSAQAALLSGDIDGYHAGSFAMQSALTSQGFNVASGTMWYTIYFLIFASAVPNSPLADVRVRQAIGYAIDSESIAKNIDKGLSFASNQYAVEGTPFYGKDVKGYGYDVNKAKQLLAEAGYPNGFVTTIYTGTDQPMDRYMVAVQGYLAAVGIKLNLVYQDVSLWTTKTLYGIDEGMILAGHGFGINLVNQMVSNFSKRAVAGVGMLKNSKLHPDDLDEAIMSALGAKDPETMIKFAQSAEKMIVDKYCLGYPIVLGRANTVILNKKIVDEYAVATNNEYYDLNGIYRIK